MSTLARAAAATALFLAATTVFARELPNPADAVTNTAAAAVDQAATSAPQAQSSNDDWRMKRHNGRWWYWQPSNQWVVWHQQQWVPYKPGMFAAERTANSNRAVRRYSYDPQSQYYPRVYRAPRPAGASKSIRYAGSKINADYAPYTGGSMQ